LLSFGCGEGSDLRKSKRPALLEERKAESLFVNDQPQQVSSQFA